MGVKHRVSTLAGNIASTGLKSTEICRIEGPSKTGGRRRNTLHEEGNTEGVHAFAQEVLK